MAVQMTEEQFARMLEGMTNARVSAGSFSKCTARFRGSRIEAKVDEFIRTIECYKKIEKVSEENALQGFPLLLEDFAATWWNGVQHEARTFADACRLVRKHFSPAKPDYKIYIEIFGTAQQPNIPTDTFICEKRSLFSQIPEPKPTESMQIGMIFGLLHIDIRKHIKREDMTTFSILLQKAREVELIESEQKQAQPSLTPVKPQKKRCNYCRQIGHEEINCRKKEKGILRPVEPTNQKLSNDESSSRRCYGCGAPGYYRSNCPSCSTDIKPSPKKVEFYTMNTKFGVGIPTIYISVCGIPGIAHIDTGARTSVASKKLYNKLLEFGCKFTKTMANITLADGKTQEQRVYATTVPIDIGNRCLQLKLITLENAADNRTLLGIDFLEQARILLNPAQRAWCFDDDFKQWFRYDLADADPNLITKHVEPVVLNKTSIDPTRRTENLSGIEVLFKTPRRPKEQKNRQQSKADSNNSFIGVEALLKIAKHF